MASVSLNAQMPDVKHRVADMYLVNLVVRRDGANVVNLSTPIPETFELSLSSNYDHPMDQPLSSLAGNAGGLVTQVVRAGTVASTGLTTRNKYLSGAVWIGGSRINVSLPFILHAYKDPKKDVMDKVVQLMSLVAPSEGIGGMLVAPGPTLANMEALAGGNFSQDVIANAAQWGGDDITLSIGKFFTLNPCIITNVGTTIETMFDRDGIPIGATVNVSVESYFTTTKEDLIKHFKSSITFGGSNG